jgi:hypothetical protein
MTTGLDLVTSTMRKIGALTKNETPSSDEADDGIEIINDLIESWANDSLVLYARTLESFNLTAGDGTYTIGSGGDINTTRPINILDFYIRSGTTDYTDTDIISDEDFARIENKSSQGIPKFLNYDGGFPTGTIKLHPVPSAAYTLFLLSEKQLSGLTLAGTVSLPPGWKRAIIYNAAIDMGPEYGQPVSQEIYQIAQESLGLLKLAAAKVRSMDVPTGNSVGNIYTGWQ